MNFQGHTILEGQIIRLEPLTIDHAADLAAVAEPDIFAYHLPPTEFTENGFRDLITRVKQRPNWLLYAIVPKATGKAIGTTAYIDINAPNKWVEIGFTWIAKSHQGTRVNPEMKYLMLKHAFEEQGANRVQLKTDSRNTHSQRAIEKLGAVREGVLRKHMIMFDGHIRDTVMYSITDDDWPQVKANLEARLQNA